MHKYIIIAVDKTLQAHPYLVGCLTLLLYILYNKPAKNELRVAYACVIIQVEPRRKVKAMVVNGIDVTLDGLTDISEKEIAGYIDLVQKKTNEKISSLELKDAGNGKIDIHYVLQPQKFERIRRITGYLVGTIDRWNNAKQSEEHDRVKHAIMR